MSKDVVLVTAVGNIGTGSQIVECLYSEKKQNTVIIGCDISEHNICCLNKLDRFYKVPRATDIIFSEELERIITDNKVNIMFIASVQEALWFYENKSFFSRQNVKVVLGEKALFDLCMNKEKLFLFLQLNGIEVPRFKKIIDIQDCEDIDYFPVVLKPNKLTTGSNHVYIAFDHEELVLLCQYAQKNQLEMLVQEWKGNSKHEYSASVIRGKQGRIYGSVAINRDFSGAISRKITYKKNNREYIISSGITQGIVDKNIKLHAELRQVADVLKSIGPLNIQGIWEDNHFWIIDVHPAITHGVHARAYAGYNEPVFWMELLLHDNIVQLKAKEIRISRNLIVQGEDI